MVRKPPFEKLVSQIGEVDCCSENKKYFSYNYRIKPSFRNKNSDSNFYKVIRIGFCYELQQFSSIRASTARKAMSAQIYPDKALSSLPTVLPTFYFAPLFYQI